MCFPDLCAVHRLWVSFGFGPLLTFVASKIHRVHESFGPLTENWAGPFQLRNVVLHCTENVFSFHVIRKLSVARIACKIRVKVTAGWGDVPYDPQFDW